MHWQSSCQTPDPEDDKIMVRLHGLENNKRSESSKSTNTLAHYSKQDILEQYCISERGLGALENGGHSIFGCLSTHSNYSCSSRNAPSLLTGCLRQRVSSDENLYKLYSRNPCDFAPYPKKQWYPWSPNMTLQEQDLRSSYFRKRTYGDPRRFTWMPSEEESIRMEKPRSITDLSYRNNTLTQSKKHVSFARSHTLTSFDDAMSSLNSSSSHLNRITRSQERLLDLRKCNEAAITKQPKMSESGCPVDAKVIKGPMKTQATQTDTVLAKKAVPSAHISFSPKSLQRAKMVSQAAQTNGFNGRKLTKSISEAGSTFASPLNKDRGFFVDYPDHEPVHRTQSDEPPRSPFLTTPAPNPFIRENPSQSETSSLSKSEDHESEDSTDPKKEIFIDYKPQLPYTQTKKPLVKTFSDGVILTEKKNYFISEDRVVPSVRPTYTSMSHENLHLLDSTQLECKPHFQKAPIKDEGVCPMPLEENIYSSVDAGLQSQDSIDEEFHENYMLNRQESIETDIEAICERISLGDESIVPSVYFQHTKFSPFASNDSLANEARDQSDDIWNESQVTVLQVDSGTDNGTALSTSETVSASPKVPSILLSPSSKRKHLLMMQHQQKSSFDMDPLDEEAVEDVLKPISNEKPINTLEVPRMLQFAPIKPNKSKHQTLRSQSPLRFRNYGEPSVGYTTAESPLPAVVPELLLTATDSCKTNTDLSESTTTDDYLTANSGTDSSRKSTSFQVVPSLSPSVSPDAHQFLHADHISINAISYAKGSHPGTGRSTPSDDSSSCGSYSIERSTPDLLKGYSATPDPPEKPSWSDEEERSERRYSSSGYYESPMENELKKPNEYITTKCREVNFNLSTSKCSRSKQAIEANKTAGITGENHRGNNDKGKRSKSRARSPMQQHKKNTQGRRSPYKDKASPIEDKGYKVTSDESSTGQEYLNPRKTKKNKDNLRRKSLPRSPTYQKNQKKSDVSKYQSNSLPSSLSRKKSKKHPKGWQQQEHHDKKNTEESPTTSTKDTITLKALSTESLRSVSPGSDSVFYSDPGGQALADQQGHCLHCGKEVVHENDGDTPTAKSHHGHQQHHHHHHQQQFIVQPPAGFEDSPKVKVEKLFKKLDKRLKSEERGQGEHRRYKRTSDMRAKSEERCGGAAASSSQRGRLRPMQNSPFCSKEHLASANSSPSILPGAPEEENDQGLYAACYEPSRWLHVDEKQSNGILSPSGSEGDRRCSISSTESEHELCKRYQGIVHKNAHRKPYVDMYKRLHFKTFDCDKTIVVQRESGEFGFRIHGSKPVVVTAIENGTPAELSGLQVGDIIITVNGVNVLDKSHSDVVQIAHAGSDILTLEVARTSLSPCPTKKGVLEPGEVLSGYLWRLSGHGRGYKSNKWIRRWFSLRRNSCLYFYKTDTEKQPVGVVMLLDQNIQELDDNVEPSKLNKFVIFKNEYRFYVAADSIEERTRWVDEIRRCVNDNQDNYLEKTKTNLSLSPSAISDPDCFGYLTKLGSQWKSWNKRYCVLKDAALYFYHDANSTSPFGVTLLHGYKVQLSSSIKKHGFEVLAPDVTKKHYYFCAESDSDRKRWISAMEYSIDRWLKLH
ncbi:uncharacterized protein LOC126740017 isoform X5 [Anthonomus grandis grandis]|uniref:uncharacterized protein LOC126740017 isoform X5 n=1 Tax=Anthonomus grandis grandis TaxID=2921223 RepID=UPI002165041B|nr:uncharacterized protein LOC126740017 isoform X5 [Anthonomus grandis grandis]